MTSIGHHPKRDSKVAAISIVGEATECGRNESVLWSPGYDATSVPDSSHLVAFAVAAIAIAAIPGPGILYVLARTIAGGSEVGLRSSVGTGVGGLAHVLAAAVGLSALIATSATAFSIVKYVGAAYLIYLGCRTLMSRNRGALIVSSLGERPPGSGAVYLTEVLNPKTALSFLTFLPQFCQSSRGPLCVADDRARHGQRRAQHVGGCVRCPQCREVGTAVAA